MAASAAVANSGTCAPRVKISVAFQVGQDGDVLQRRRCLTFKASDSLLKVYHEISGDTGTAALWPRDFGEKVQNGSFVYLFVRLFTEPDCGQLDDDAWYFPMPQTRLSELVLQHSEDSWIDGSVVQMLFRIESPNGDFHSSDPLRLKAISHASTRTKRVSGCEGLALEHRRTFLHVVDGSLLAPTRSYAESEPGAGVDEAEAKPVVGKEAQLATPAVSTCAASGGPATSSISGSGSGSGGALGGLGGGPDGPSSGSSVAAQGDDEETAVQHLPSAGPPCPGADEESKRLLFHSVLKVFRDQVEHLVLHRFVDICAVDVKGNSVMHFWARSTTNSADLKIVGEFLISAGADVNATRPKDGMTPLHHAVVSHNNRKGWGDFHKVLFLIRHGANVGSLTFSGQTPLDVLRPDGRASTQSLRRYLQLAASQNSIASSTCGTLGCQWCA